LHEYINTTFKIRFLFSDPKLHCMKIIITLFSICVSSNSIFAQPDLLLKNFKYRISHYQAINLNANSSSQFGQVNLPAGTLRNNETASGVNGNYYFEKSTDKILLTANTSLNGDYYQSKSHDRSNVNNSKNFSSGSVLSVSNKWFSKGMFFELGADASGVFFSTRDVTNTNPSASKGNNTLYGTSVTLGIGQGRLENITDMQNALWLYKELVNEQRLSGTLSATELIGLGQSITKGNNTRVLDARRRTKFLLTTVDNYLQQKGLVSKTDIAYFSSLNDILFYAYNSPRLAGTEKFIRFIPSTRGVNGNQSQPNGIEKAKHNFNTQVAMLSIGYNKYVPAGLIHQNNYGAAINFSYTGANLTDRFFTNGIVTNEFKSKTILKKAGVNLFYEHAIYPNTRTNINFSLQGDLGYQDSNDRHFYAASNVACTVNYFISYHTRLTASLGSIYQKNMYDISDYIELLPNAFQLVVSAGLQISL
jgi:hypothetical protein